MKFELVSWLVLDTSDSDAIATIHIKVTLAKGKSRVVDGIGVDADSHQALILAGQSAAQKVWGYHTLKAFADGPIKNGKAIVSLAVKIGRVDAAMFGTGEGQDRKIGESVCKAFVAALNDLSKLQRQQKLQRIS